MAGYCPPGPDRPYGSQQQLVMPSPHGSPLMRTSQHSQSSLPSPAMGPRQPSHGSLNSSGVQTQQRHHPSYPLSPPPPHQMSMPGAHLGHQLQQSGLPPSANPPYPSVGHPALAQSPPIGPIAGQVPQHHQPQPYNYPPSHHQPGMPYPPTPTPMGGAPQRGPPQPGGGRHPLQRQRTRRNVTLTNGNLVILQPVPSRLLQGVEFTTSEEFTHMRYTAATCDPNDFAAQRYTLRQAMYNRQTEIFVVMTMYNENDELFIKTMSAVMKNVAFLCGRNNSQTWGKNSWQKITVCIVADGRKKCNERVLTVLAAMGVYQEGVAKNCVNGRETTAHIFEYTAQLMVDNDLEVRRKDRGVVPVQILFCLKEQNKKKLNSHRWFFNAFGPILRPNICVLLDVGTRPTTPSIYHLWKAFDRDGSVAGACGEIAADLGPSWANVWNPLVAAQNFEYKMSNILDKPMESVFGYISVLPGAFSAYRYAALLDYERGRGPLSAYFKGETMHGAGAGVFEANMYLAEDRILCFELVAKPHCSWLLKYVKAARAETDVPDNVPEFISQRRRWLNGSFFAATYALYNWGAMWRTNHAFSRKLALQVEFFYNTVSQIFSWFALGNFYLTFYFLTITSELSVPSGVFGPPSESLSNTLDALRSIYIFAVVTTFICALGNRPQGSRWIYVLSILLFGVFQIIMVAIAGFEVYRGVEDAVDKAGQPAVSLRQALLDNGSFTNIVISLGSTYGIYLVASVISLDPWHMLTSFLQYVFFLPSFVNILMVYAFCNIHDVSWGTKGDNATAADLGAAVAKKDQQSDNLVVELELPDEAEDLNQYYDRIVNQELKNRPQAQHKSRDATTKKEDYYKNFRTKLILSWMITNTILVLVLTHSGDPQKTSATALAYLSFIFWTVTALSLFRFLGCVMYLFSYFVFG